MQYELNGAPFPTAVCRLMEDETILCRRGAMVCMSPEMRLSAAGSEPAGKPIPESCIFRCGYTASGGPGEIVLSPSAPGNILPAEISPEKTIAVRKSAYLASGPAVEISLFYQKIIGSASLGSVCEDFILLKLSGEGTAFLEISGGLVERVLGKDETIIVSTGCLAAMETSCTPDVSPAMRENGTLWVGEGSFTVTVKGPGRVWLQTIPAPSSGSSSRRKR